MEYRILRMPNEKFSLVWDGAPSNFHALQMAPEVMEPELQVGCWLVLLLAVWSGADMQAVDVACQVMANSNSRSMQLGVRPFDNHSEFQSWCPSITEKYQSPIWLYLENGNLKAEKKGLLKVETVTDWIGGELKTAGVEGN